MIRNDLHVHLYGCLTPGDIWELGRDIWRDRRGRLEAFARRYEAAFGVDPNYESYWVDDAGAANLARDFLCTTPSSFEQFESKFALPIALFPVSHARDDLRVLRRVMERHRDQGLVHVEYRFVYPPVTPLTASYSLKEHLDGLCQCMADFESESSGVFDARLALSVSRDPGLGMEQYLAIKSWQEASSPMLKRHLTGIDFSGYEEDSDAAGIREICARLHSENSRSPANALALLIHAGETTQASSVSDGIRRVEMAARMGAHRIGHAVALGADCDEETRALQSRVRRWIADETKSVIECCITSNIILAGVRDVLVHPVRGFVADGLRVCLATDDPGIFETDARLEYAKAIQVLGPVGAFRILDTTPAYQSAVLSGRA